MLNISELKEEDIGRWVVYNGFNREEGRLKSWNSLYIFVVYKCDYQWDRFQDFTAAATDPEDLDWLVKNGA